MISLGGIWLRGGLLLLSLLGLHEFYRALSDKIKPVHYIGFLTAFIYFIFFMYGIYPHFLILVSALVLSVIAVTVIFYGKTDIKDSFVTVCGFFYIPFMFSFIYFVREANFYFVWLIFTSASASDTFAYLVGKKWGRRRLVNTPSPNKSMEGCIGGVAGAALVGLIYGFAVAGFTELNYNVNFIVFGAAVISALGAVFSQFGDFFASAVKRSAGIKDFGRLLPGHGGILDRFDGILAAAPIVYMVTILLWI